MKTHRRPKSASEAHAGALDAKLEDAIARAKRAEFDLPSALTIERATALFRALMASRVHPGAIEVNVAVDGAIAIGASNGNLSAVVEFDPSSGASEIIVSDENQRTLLHSARDLSDPEIVRELERAA